MQLINLFLPHVFEVILVDLGGFESERLNAAQIFEVFLCKGEFRKCRRRKIGNLLKALVLIRENELRNSMIFSGDGTSCTKRIDGGVTFERIFGECFPKL